MKTKIKPLSAAVISALFGAAIGATMTSTAAAPCMPCAPRAGERNPFNTCAAKNPCQTKNPCAAMNPCATKNPYAAKNPCAAGDRVDPKLVTRPNGTEPYQGDMLALVTEGRDLWNSKAISRNNSVSCSTCHQDGTTMLQPGFAKPYPHSVQMAKDAAGMESITLEGMVQLCMIKPMQSKPFAWDSRQLAALTAYTSVLQRTFKPVGNTHNPCAAKNPCTAKNPCVVNPCAAMKNPCAVMNPCAARH